MIDTCSSENYLPNVRMTMNVNTKPFILCLVVLVQATKYVNAATQTTTTEDNYSFQRVVTVNFPPVPSGTNLRSQAFGGAGKFNTFGIYTIDLSTFHAITARCTPKLTKYTGYYYGNRYNEDTVTNVYHGTLTSKCTILWEKGYDTLGSGEGDVIINDYADTVNYEIRVYDEQGRQINLSTTAVPPDLQMAEVKLQYVYNNVPYTYTHIMNPNVKEVTAVQKTALTITASDKGMVTGNAVFVEYTWKLEQTGPTVEYDPAKTLYLFATQIDDNIKLTLKDPYSGEQVMKQNEALPVSLSTNSDTGSGNIEFAIRERPGYGSFTTRVRLTMEWK